MDLHPGQAKRHISEEKRAESDPIRRALQENEGWYRDLVEYSQDLLCIHDLEGRLLSVNPTPARTLGYSVQELLEIPMRELVAPEFRPQFDAYLREIAEVGEASGYLAVMARSGERRIWQYHNVIRTEGVAAPIVRGIAHDITEQMRTEKLLREAGEGLLREVHKSEFTIRDLKLFRTLVDQSNDAIEVVDPETMRFLDANEKACSELGYSREELLSMRVFDINPTATEISVARAKEHLQKSGSMVVEGIHRRKDGITFPVEISIRVVRLERDYIVAIVRNLAERKLAESRLRASQDRYRAVHDLSPVGICWVETRSGRLLRVNPKYCEIVGRTEEELLKCTFQSMTHPDDLPGNLEKVQRLAMGEIRHFEIEKRFLRPDGSVRWVEVEVVATQAEADIPVWHMAIVQDITERKRSEDLLREYESVVEGASEIILVVDREYRYMLANRAYLNFRGMNRENVVGHLLPELMGKEIFEATIKEKMDECFAGNAVRFEKKYKFPNIGERDMLVSYFPIEGHTGVDRVACVMQDVTESRRAEQSVRYAEDFSQNVIQTANVMIVGLDTNGNVNLLNAAGEEITGYSFSELKGKSWSTLVPRDRFPQVWEEFDRLLEGTAGETFENAIFTKTGEERYIAWRNSQVKVNGTVAATISFGNDMTERIRAERALRRSEENYRMFVSQSSEGIFREDLDAPVPIGLPEENLILHILHDSYLVECNDAMARMYGLTSGKELIGKRLTEMVPADDPRNIQLTREYIRSGFRVLDRESHEIDIHGNPKVFLNSMIGIVENGMLMRTWGIQRDVTEKVRLEESRHQAEEALRENLAKLQVVTEELRQAKEKLSEEKLYLEQAIDTELGFGEIIGRSNAIKDVMDKVSKVAPSDATVLLLGETGTGKELLARAIHRLSKRSENSFIKLNCAAIPSGLLESELFGHEKGAFTGAVAKKVGRLELADHGTLFLDEIGEIPLDLQPKLLRVLQDHEFERLGGTQTLKVNFRLVAATNRDLLESVSRREFRSDLYYRLNVFPLRTPPLRERRGDIPLLIEHFVRKYASRMNKSILSIPARTMETLVRWEWPGNIRELENFVERSVILTPGPVLQVPLGELHANNDSGESITLRDKERESILRALRECNGQLGGPNGAAARLGLKRTTLQSKLAGYGIDPGGYRA
jgi:PAS domain S-box-containing protein